MGGLFVLAAVVGAVVMFVEGLSWLVAIGNRP
jgi:hypothetical protein